MIYISNIRISLLELMRHLLVVFPFLVMLGCTSSVKSDITLGPEDFVMESYQIKERDPDSEAYQKKGKVIVMGEVTHQSSLPVQMGSLSLKEALALSGGLSEFADEDEIRILRMQEGKTINYTLTLEHLLRLPPDALQLIPGDTVYVGAKPVYHFMRSVTSPFRSISLKKTKQ